MGSGTSKGDGEGSTRGRQEPKSPKSDKGSKASTSPEPLPVPKIQTSSITRQSSERIRRSNSMKDGQDVSTPDSARSRTGSVRGLQEAKMQSPSMDGQPDIVKSGIVKSANDLEEKDQGGNTAMMRFCKIGQDKKVKALLEAGAPFNTQNLNGATAVYFAAEHGHEACCQAIIDREIQLFQDAKNAGKKGSIAGMSTMVKSYASTSVKDIPTKEGFTPVYIATLKGHVKVLAILLSNGAKTECKNEDGETPLCLAVLNNNLEAMKLLIFAGANKEARTTEGSTPIILAARKNHAKCVAQLLDDGANGEAARHDGWQAFHVAAHNGFLETIKVLGKGGVEHHHTNKAGRTALWMAEKKKHTEVAKYIRDVL